MAFGSEARDSGAGRLTSPIEEIARVELVRVGFVAALMDSMLSTSIIFLHSGQIREITTS